MVYCGKPSKACHECRRRRTRCNEARPSCSQCLRAGRKCTGYRDLDDLLFRHENKGTFNSRKPFSPSSTSLSPLPIASLSLSQKPLSKDKIALKNLRIEMVFPLSPSAEDQAESFVFRNYVSVEEERGLFDYLPSLYQNCSSDTTRSFLQDAVLALGLAGIANSRRQSEIMGRAGWRYAAAVKGIRNALGKVEEARRDEVLVAVLLLGLYETSASDKPASLRSWMQHTKGASSLLKLRGDDQMKTHIGRRLFTQIRSQFITSCIQTRNPIPPEIKAWSLLSLPHESRTQATSTRLSFILSDFCSLRSTLPSPSHPPSQALISHILHSGQKLHLALQNWATDLPREYKYESIPVSKKTEDVYTEYYHVYTSLHTASTWNTYRAVHIMVLDILLTYLPYSSPSHTLAPPSSLSTHLNSLATSLAASIPYHFNYHTYAQHSLWIRPPARSIAGNLLIWPLYTTILYGRTGEGMREWLAGRLRRVGEEMGVRHAVALGVVLERGGGFEERDEECCGSLVGDGILGREGSGSGNGSASGSEREDWEEFLDMGG